MPNKTDSIKRDISFCNETNLRIYLKDKNSFSESDKRYIKYFIDNFSECWRLWNRVRWNEAFNSEGIAELKSYLGEDFIPYYDSSWGLAKEWTNKKPSTQEQIAEFYRNTKNYVYNLTVWHESGDRHNYAKDIDKLIHDYGINSVIDFGCGVGTDTISFLKRGLITYSVDFSCPAVDFMKWRLKKQKLKTNFIDVEKLTKFPSADMFWAIDVFEHILDPLAILDSIDLKACKVFAHCSRFNDNAGGRHPCHINFEPALMSDFLLTKGFKNISVTEDLAVWINLSLVRDHS